MSKRDTEAKTLLQISHERQIEALLNEDIEAWLDAALLGPPGEDSPEGWRRAMRRLTVVFSDSVATAAWYSGLLDFSLFAHLPGCLCPVLEKCSGRFQDELLIPSWRQPPLDWRPTREVLETFARIQQAHR